MVFTTFDASKMSMYTYPSDIGDKIEFTDILQRVAYHCRSEMGRKQSLNIVPSSDPKVVKKLLQEVFQLLSILNKGVSVPLTSFENIVEDVKMLSKEGFILDPEAILRIQKILLISLDLRVFFMGDHIAEIEGIKGFAQRFIEGDHLIKAIDRVYDREGLLRPDASPELLKISKNINAKNRELDKAFTTIAASFKQKAMLSDSVESYRNGRRVLSVPAENKRKVRGIIHDESSTGKTAFIEPEQVIDINNQIFDLETEKKKEVYRILRQLCDELRPYIEDIVSDYHQLIEVDVILAKARLAKELDATLPNIVDQPLFAIKEGRHAYLYLKNSNENKKTVPFDLELNKPNKLLLLSGPNAGGKSVTMKAVALIHMMVQSGLLPTVEENSTIGVFDKILCDIGDQQSLDDDLSTYSSRLTNMVRFLEEANDKSLILIDEFGSGTDPKIGGAIAEAILKELNHKRVWGVITTHYSNLKFFAYKTKGIVNGGMLFDKENLGPSYQLKIGRPGSSFAFEIAEKTGLPKRILKYARFKTGKNEKAIDQLLTDLQSEKQVLDEKIQGLSNKEQNLERLTATYNQLQSELEYRRKRLKLDIKEQKVAAANKANQEIDAILKELKATESRESAQKVLKKHKLHKEEQQEEIKELKKEIFYRKDFDESDFEVGNWAKIRESGTTGKILEVRKKKVKLAVGSFTMTVDLVNLEPTATPMTTNRSNHVSTQVKKIQNFSPKIDIRGYTKSDGIAFVQELVEQAMIRNVDMLTILHGKGSGALRNAVHKKLKEYNVEKVWHPQDDFGGEGVTYVRL